MRSKVHVFLLVGLLGCAHVPAIGCAHMPAIIDGLQRLYNGPIGTIVRQCVSDALADDEVGSCLLGPETWEQPPSVETRERVGALGRSWTAAYNEAAALNERNPNSVAARRALHRLEQIDDQMKAEIGQ